MQQETREAMEYIRGTKDAASEVINDTILSNAGDIGSNHFSSSIEASILLQKRVTIFPRILEDANSIFNAY